MFAADNAVVVVEGDAGIGKTTLLAQFAKRHPDNALSLWVEPQGRWRYDPDLNMRDLCNQLEWALYKRQLEPGIPIGESELRQRYYDLRRQARFYKRTYYFLVDGLDEVPEPEQKLILDMLPFGMKGFCILLSARSEDLPLPKGVSAKHYPLSGFVLQETERYLEEWSFDSRFVADIHTTVSGFPGHLASIKRELELGASPETLLQDLGRRIPEPFEIEWRHVTEREPELRLILLSILAHSPERHSLASLASLVDSDPQTVMEGLRDLRFVQIEDDHVVFVSQSFRSFAARKLENRRARTIDLLINHLLTDQQSDHSIMFLPTHLEQAGRHQELLSYLSPELFLDLVGRSHSLGPIPFK